MQELISESIPTRDMGNFSRNQGARTKVAVIYHGDCPDGFGAAWSAWKKFGDKADYYPALHSDKALPLRNSRVYFLDLVYERPGELGKLQKHNVVTALDHHVSARRLVSSTFDHRYALTHSGAVIAWEYFHPGKKIPKLLLYIEDNDLWKKVLPQTDEVMAHLQLYPFSFKVFDRLVRDFERPAFRRRFIAEGAFLKKFEDNLIDRIITNGARLVRFGGRTVYAINSALWTSEIGHRLYDKKPPFAIIWKQVGGTVKVSLRGTGKPDLSKLAAKYGGGGHRGAAGFTVPAGKLPWRTS